VKITPRNKHSKVEQMQNPPVQPAGFFRAPNHPAELLEAESAFNAGFSAAIATRIVKPSNESIGSAFDPSKGRFTNLNCARHHRAMALANTCRRGGANSATRYPRRRHVQ
jgi:hypothetical protein